MRKRKKEIAVKRNCGVFSVFYNVFYSVKVFIFPLKSEQCIGDSIIVKPAMNRRQIRNVALKICKTAFETVKYRGY